MSVCTATLRGGLRAAAAARHARQLVLLARGMQHASQPGGARWQGASSSSGSSSGTFGSSGAVAGTWRSVVTSAVAYSSNAAAAGGGVAGEVCSLKCQLLDVPGPLAEEIAEVLLAYGAQSVAVEEFRVQGEEEQEIFADQHAELRVWDRCTVVAYFPPDEDGGGILASTAADFGLDACWRSVEEVRTQDWEQSIRDSYQPAQVAPGLWIVPVWAQPPEPAATNIILEPGLAFGTGDHPTTRLCLRWLQGLAAGGALAGARCMDYGAGSGVLAVAALLLGAAQAVGTDIDPLSIKSTRANAALNGVGDRLDAYKCAADLAAGEPLEAAGVPPEQRLFGVTVANILQGPLVGLAPRLAAYTAPGGLLGLSGVLQDQTPAVIQAYSPWFEAFQVATEDRWAVVTAVRRRDAPVGAEQQRRQREAGS
ncbi:ribosomal L11 methyltransferase isoform B [Micractinium conductrix]|uniref:ETFB lysine methyltransferase n=1 Tax=Micractinium conductrix TaxID=554055 RepID=A0A2P6VK88_9CHLO|nr:ribosomal L11 methyltransferase isoform A [Micractinium conductrix]PSC74510.1 ribosomal L11 methyltransferase isoform B [Micractinium conductrix]|eukprot:PSC74509.1 ribosomal L11 methyltransferase isoform A [Micractinium conductrix]